MWQWLHDLQPGRATFLGWVVGFVTLVGGALINAHLNRRRDDRLRKEDQRVVASALLAELVGLRDSLQSNPEWLSRAQNAVDDGGTKDFLIRDVARVSFMGAPLVAGAETIVSGKGGAVRSPAHAAGGPFTRISEGCVTSLTSGPLWRNDKCLQARSASAEPRRVR
jgi:hypothetical protein